jgi:hypothetical protein
MFRPALILLPCLAGPALADAGLHHHPHGIEFGWVAIALAGSVVGGGLVYAVMRRRK